MKGRGWGGTHQVWRAPPVRVWCGVRRGPVGVVVTVTQVALPTFPLVYHQVDRHFAFQTGDVPVAEIIA